MINIHKYKNIQLSDHLLVFLLISTGVLFTMYFKVKNSMNFLSLDELLWMYRSRFFIDNILSLEFSNLIQSSQPGIMVMWVVGPFMQIVNYDFLIIKSLIHELNSSGIGYNTINSARENQQVYSDYRNISILLNIPIVAIMISFIISLYYLLKKLLFNKWQITFSLLLIVTTPYYIYFTTPTDKFVGMFSIISILCLLVYLGKKGGRLFLIASAVLGSWAVLSKMSALFLVPYVFFAIIFYSQILNILQNKKDNNFKIRNTANEIKHALKIYLSWLSMFIVTSIIFLPTILSNPKSVLSLVIKESSQRVVVKNQTTQVDATSVLSAYLSDNFIYSFNFFVIILFCIFFILILKNICTRKHVEKEIIILFVYFISFFAFIILFSKTYSFRYLVPILILFQIIAGLGIYELVNIFMRKYNIKNINSLYYWTIISILISQLLLIHYSEIEKIKNLPYFG